MRPGDGVGRILHPDDAIRAAIEDGKTVTQFKIGDTNCELIEGQIRRATDFSKPM